MRVSPFRNPRLNGYVRLPAAYRSLSRLSSALSAKASALRPFRLTTLCLPLSRPAILAYMAAVQILILLFRFPRGNLSMSSYLLQRFSYVTGYNLLPRGFKFYPMKDCLTYVQFSKYNAGRSASHQGRRTLRPSLWLMPAHRLSSLVERI